MKIGIFGGSFNPPHNGHVNSILTVSKKMGLDKVIIVPTNQNPLKPIIDSPSAEHRVEMLKRAFSTYGQQFEINDLEIKRGGTSYTIDTIKALKETHASDELFLIIGVDQFFAFNQWKNYKKILEETNIIVTSRPGYELPHSTDDLPPFIREQVEEFDFNFIELKSSKSIQFITLKDIEISATELRKKLRVGRPVEKFLPLSVESYIKEHALYKAKGDKIGDFKKFTEFCANTLFAKKGINVKAYDLTKMLAPSEFTLVSSGTSTKHTSALAENILKAVKEEYNVLPLSVEGIDEGRWVLIDFGALIIHLFYDFVREEYSIEKLWKEAVEVPLVDPFLNK